jgi:hypothetical protein
METRGASLTAVVLTEREVGNRSDLVGGGVGPKRLILLDCFIDLHTLNLRCMQPILALLVALSGASKRFQRGGCCADN